MTDTTEGLLKILYIGNDQEFIDIFIQSGLFETVVKENGIQAIYYLTNNEFQLFDLNEDTRYDSVYQEGQCVDAIISEYATPGINAFRPTL